MSIRSFVIYFAYFLSFYLCILSFLYHFSILMVCVCVYIHFNIIQFKYSRSDIVCWLSLPYVCVLLLLMIVILSTDLYQMCCWNGNEFLLEVFLQKISSTRPWRSSSSPFAAVVAYFYFVLFYFCCFAMFCFVLCCFGHLMFIHLFLYLRVVHPFVCAKRFVNEFLFLQTIW